MLVLGGGARPILSPYDGHGKDAVEELAAYNVMMNIKISGSETSTFTTNNEFRTMGLVLNPVLSSNTSIVANNSVYDMCTKLTTSSVVGAFVKDEFVRGATSNAYGYVVDFTNGATLRLTNVIGTFANAESLQGNTSSTTATVTNITNSSIKKYSGEVLYIENRAPISRSADQTEDLRIIIKFGLAFLLLSPIVLKILEIGLMGII